MVTKMPAKRIATSWIGAQRELVRLRARRAGVVNHERREHGEEDARRAARFPVSWCTPRSSTSRAVPGARGDRRRRATPARKRRFTAPSMRIGSPAPSLPCADVASARGSSSTGRAARRRRGRPTPAKHTSFHRPSVQKNGTPCRKPEEERRVAERRQAAADVGDQEDEEDDRVGAVVAVRGWPAAAAGSSPSRRRWCRPTTRAPSR